MKTCGYCGRENEDSAVACRECGQSEFPETAARKTSAPSPISEPEPEPVTPDVDSGEEAAICSHCLFPNHPEREWCKQCGTPFNTTVMGPFETAIARGCMYRGIVQGRPKPIVFVTVWVSCLPIFILSVFMILAGIVMAFAGTVVAFLLYIPLGALLGSISGSFLFQVTRNLLVTPKPKFEE